MNKKSSFLLVFLCTYCILPGIVYAQVLGSIQSFNKQDYYFTYHNDIGIIYPVENRAGKELATFIIRKGLAAPDDNFCVSFESAAWPGNYLKHQDRALKLLPVENDVLFQRDATFKMVFPLGTDDRKWVSFESFNYPGYYIRHKNSRLLLDKNDKSKIFKMDATFRFMLPLWNGKNKTVKTKTPVHKQPSYDRDATTIIILTILGIIYISLNLAAKIKQKRAHFATLEKSKQAADSAVAGKLLTPKPVVEPGAESIRKTDQTIT